MLAFVVRNFCFALLPIRALAGSQGRNLWEPKMAVIAMTREMGSRGKDVARLVADRLDLTIVHQEMIESTAERSEEDAPSEVNRFLDVGREPEAHANGGMIYGGYLTPAEVLGLALRGNVLIRGWGAPRLLRGIPHILAVRVCAPMEQRVEEMRRRLGVDQDTAQREIRRSDAGHAQTFLRFFAADWRVPTNYGLVLNTGNLSVEACADIVLNAARSVTLAETPESRRMLEDRLLEARISEALRRSGPLQRHAAHVESHVQDGRVRLYGAVSSKGTAREIEELVSQLAGADRVESDLVFVRGYADGR